MAGARPARPAPRHGRRVHRAAGQTRVVPLPDGAVVRPRREHAAYPAVTAHRALTAADGRPGVGWGRECSRRARSCWWPGERVRSATPRSSSLAGRAPRSSQPSAAEEKADAGPGGRSAPRRELPRRPTRRRRCSRSRRTAWTSPSRSRPRRTSGSTSTSCRVHGLVSIYANNGGDELTMPSARGVRQEPALPVPHPLHPPRTAPGPGRDRGRHGGDRGWRAASRGGSRPPAAPLPARGTPGGPRTPSRAAL